MKKGFTLIELLGVIILLGVIALIAYPIVENAIKNSSKKALEETIVTIERAALQYSTVNKLGYDKIYKALDLNILKESGFLKDEQIINPETDEPLNGCVVYVWDESTKQYSFVYSDECTLPTEETCFEFDKETQSIINYDINCTKDVIIPGVIDGVSVDVIETGSFRNKEITSVDFSYLTTLETIKSHSFAYNNLSAIDITKLKGIQEFSDASFVCNEINRNNFIGTDAYQYNYFDFSCE